MTTRWIAGLLKVYLIGVFTLTLMALPHQEGGLNLRPLATITQDLNGGGWGLVVNFAGNLGLLAPVGFLLPILRPTWASAWRIIGVGASLSLLIETLQFASGRRVADVDDVLLNAASAGLGYLAFVVCRRFLQPPTYRDVVTPTRAHIDAKGQVEQRGAAAAQTDLPNGTSRSLISTQ